MWQTWESGSAPENLLAVLLEPWQTRAGERWTKVQEWIGGDNCLPPTQMLASQPSCWLYLRYSYISAICYWLCILDFWYHNVAIWLIFFPTILIHVQKVIMSCEVSCLPLHVLTTPYVSTLMIWNHQRLSPDHMIFWLMFCPHLPIGISMNWPINHFQTNHKTNHVTGAGASGCTSLGSSISQP